MKIAYIILAYDNPSHLYNLLMQLDSSNNDIYVHIDKKSDIQKFKIPKSNRIYVSPDRIEIFWGEFSQIQAVLNLLKEATKKSHDYYILLYGSDYPVRSNLYIKKYLNKKSKKEYINLVKMPNVDKNLDRIEYYHFLKSNRNSTCLGLIKRLLNQAIRHLNLKRKFPENIKNMTLYGGSSWWIFSQNCIEYIQHYIDTHPEYVRYWKNTLIPDESFFHTIVGNSKFVQNIVPNVMYTNWVKGAANPKIIQKEDLEIIKKGRFTNDYGQHDILFARKFSDSTQGITKIIRRLYLKTQ